ncbi:hypothetical protein NXC24_PC02075 (plasmid) [Rhizobium sp. NXC24]|nr:hypothetical protein NXC24_PC02075 [Rhizobium sp. NXC24]
MAVYCNVLPHDPSNDRALVGCRRFLGMSELKAMRRSVGATQTEMANEMRVSLREYRDIGQSVGLLSDSYLRLAS